MTNTSSPRGVRWLGGAVLAGALGACHCGASVTRTEPVPAPGGGAWRSAWIEEERTPAGTRMTDMGPSRHEAQTTRTLVLTAADGEEARLPLAPPATPGEPRYALEFAPDAHALALSDDDGRSFRYVALDTQSGPSSSPLFCRHVAFARTGANLFDAAPTTRALVLEILASPPGCAAPPGARSHADDLTNQEFYGAVRYVVGHADDTAARLALGRAFLLPDAVEPWWDPRGIFENTRGDAAKLAAAHDDVRALLLAGLEAEPPTAAAAVLAHVPRPEVGEALATALERRLAAPAPTDRDRASVAWLAWALARVTTTGAGGTDAVVATLVRLADGSPALQGLEGASNRFVLVQVVGILSRRLAVQALAVLARSSAPSRAALERLATGACRRIRTATGDVLDASPPLPRFSPEVRDLVRYEQAAELEQRLDTACWAQAALRWVNDATSTPPR